MLHMHNSVRRLLLFVCSIYTYLNMSTLITFLHLEIFSSLLRAEVDKTNDAVASLWGMESCSEFVPVIHFFEPGQLVPSIDLDDCQLRK